MSVRNEIFLIYGYKLQNCNYDDIESVEFPWQGRGAAGNYGVLYDGMNGDYVIAGKCIAIQNCECDETFEVEEIPRPQDMNDIELYDWLLGKGLLSFVVQDSPAFYLISHWH